MNQAAFHKKFSWTYI